MGRTKAKIFSQPDEFTCGPTALKTAMGIMGLRSPSLKSLIKLCRTNQNGTSVRKLIAAANRLGLSVLALEWASLRHLQAALRHHSQKPRAVIVDYLYDLNEDESPHEDSGHYAAVASYSNRNARIVLLDSSNGKKRSYLWSDFLNRWYDFDFKRRQIKNGPGRHFRLVKNWNNRLMLVVARNPKFLPKFKISTAKLFLPLKPSRLPSIRRPNKTKTSPPRVSFSPTNNPHPTVLVSSQ